MPSKRVLKRWCATGYCGLSGRISGPGRLMASADQSACVGDGCLVGGGCTVGDGRLVGLGVTLPDTDAPPPQAASRPGTTPREQSLRNVRRFISCGEALSGCLSARSIGIRKSFHRLGPISSRTSFYPTVDVLSWPIHSHFFRRKRLHPVHCHS